VEERIIVDVFLRERLVDTTTQMIIDRTFSRFAISVSLAILLGGCAVYEKCGFSGCPGDSETASAVRAALGEYPALGGASTVRVQSLNHVVYLTGLVDTDVERLTAVFAAQQVSGVARVEDSISVSNGPR
jgi:hypothetical protein